MKIRFGFVSNSSTTSFCIYGVCIDESPFEDTDKLYDVCDKKGLEVVQEPWGDYIWVGKSLADMKDDQTFKEFKNEVEALLKELKIPIKELGVHQEAWHD